MISGNNIKQIGKYISKIRLHREVIIDFPFEVVSEKKQFFKINSKLKTPASVGVFFYYLTKFR